MTVAERDPEARSTNADAEQATPARWRVRLTQGVLLTPRVSRTIRWVAPTVGAAIGLAFLFQTAHSDPLDVDKLILAVRVAAVAVSLGGAFALDDRAAETLESSPASVPFQRALRVIIALPLLVVMWAVILVYAATISSRIAGTGAVVILPVGALWLEFASMVAVTWAAAAVATPYVPEGLGGVAAAPALFGFVAAGAFIRQLALFAGSPGEAAWKLAHSRWLVVLGVALTILIEASRDPWRRHRLARPVNRLGSRLRQTVNGTWRRGNDE
jgi:hypothetical protein